MKKQFCIATLFVVLTLVYGGCGAKENTDETAALPQTGSEETVDTADYIIDPGIESNGNMDAFLADFEEALEKAGLALEGKSSKEADTLGALEGYGFNINNMPIEVYLFDPENKDEKTVENLKTAGESGYITVFGTEINGETPKPKCTMNQNVVLIFPGEDIGLSHPDKDVIVQAFMSI